MIAQCDAKLPAIVIRRESYCFYRFGAMRYRTVQSQMGKVPGSITLVLLPPFALLRHHQAAWCRQHDHRDQAVALHLQGSFAHLL